MSYANKYRIPILNPGIAGNDGVHFSIVIQERGYSGSETIFKGNASGAILRYIDNEETKYPPIQASELSISFYSENNFNLEEIITDDDLQYRVLINSGDFNSETEKTLWYGFLVVDDCFEPMQDDPKEITLKATDGLGLLKSSTLYDIDVYEKKTLLEIISQCLSFTGLEIDLLIECSIFEKSMSDRRDDDKNHPFNQCKVHTRSFLKDQNTYNNCYEVLSSIMQAFQCSIFQQAGRWQIQRKHDRWNYNLLQGTLLSYPYTIGVGTALSTDYKLTIDRVERFPIGADHLKAFNSGVNHSRVQYNYDIPKQLPRNSNFQQGDFYSPPSGQYNNAYRINYWRYEVGSNTVPETVSRIPYRNQTYQIDTGAPDESYIVLPRRDPSLNEDERLVSDIVDVSKDDYLTISGSMRTKQHTVGAGNMFLMKLVMRPYSGGVYSLDYSVGAIIADKAQWKPGIGQVVLFSFGSDYDLTKWQTFDIITEGFPDYGTVEIWLYEGSVNTYDNQTWFKGLTFKWNLLFVNNTTRVIGERDQINNTGTRKKNVEQGIVIGDAPKKIISGALFRMDETTLTRSWHRHDKEESEKLIRINDIALYQSSYRLYTKVDGSFLGISYESDSQILLIGPANIFYFNVEPLLNKFYLPTNLEINIGANTFTASLQEHYDTTKDNGDPQGATRTFNYIYE